MSLPKILKAPLTAPQAALHARPFGVGNWTVEPTEGRIGLLGHTPIAVDSDAMLVLVILAADAGQTLPLPQSALEAAIGSGDDDRPIALIIESLRGLLGTQAIEKTDCGYRLTARVSINANDSGAWQPQSDRPTQPSPIVAVGRSRLGSRMIVMAIAVAGLLVLLFLLR